eukprot:CAMPEP_0176050734 /NCGR_PEP_ID=MMETSP0120_2-20121206/25218_1 /TAXON_ID=160619 /ORGANISM="Kryptoperidinium foliaceum, Strain CCMP 1326" /LENGTH=330 /DNA_ID=CAMNT_0017384169 /DNA_START=34 /DNA_END=1023 /DNA_ORIENTATION=-
MTPNSSETAADADAFDDGVGDLHGGPDAELPRVFEQSVVCAPDGSSLEETGFQLQLSNEPSIAVVSATARSVLEDLTVAMQALGVNRDAAEAVAEANVHESSVSMDATNAALLCKGFVASPIGTGEPQAVECDENVAAGKDPRVLEEVCLLPGRSASPALGEPLREDSTAVLQHVEEWLPAGGSLVADGQHEAVAGPTPSEVALEDLARLRQASVRQLRSDYEARIERSRQLVVEVRRVEGLQDELEARCARWGARLREAQRALDRRALNAEELRARALGAAQRRASRALALRGQVAAWEEEVRLGLRAERSAGMVAVEEPHRHAGRRLR